MKLIPGWAKKRVIEHELNKLEKEKPVIRKVLDWLTDPTATGRKRSIALVAALLSGAFRGIHGTLLRACAEATVAGAWCRVDPTAWATVVDTVNGAIQVIQPGMDFAAVAFAVVGFVHQRQKSNAGKLALAPVDYVAGDL